MSKKIFLIFCLFFSLFVSQFLYSEEQTKFIIYQTELEQLKLCFDNIETEKKQISETLKLQINNYNVLENNLNKASKALTISETKTLELENNLTALSNKLKIQENTQLKLVEDLKVNQSQLMTAEQSLTELKKEVKSNNFKNKINNIFYLVGGIGIGMIAEKVIK